MVDRPKLSLSQSAFDVKPLALRDKALPPTPGSERVEALEYENEMLRRENQSLRNQLDIWGQQIKRYHKVADAAKVLAKETAMSVRHLQDATSTMKKEEKAAAKEWVNYQTILEKQMAEKGNISSLV